MKRCHRSRPQRLQNYRVVMAEPEPERLDGDYRVNVCLVGAKLGGIEACVRRC